MQRLREKGTEQIQSNGSSFARDRKGRCKEGGRPAWPILGTGKQQDRLLMCSHRAIALSVWSEQWCFTRAEPPPVPKPIGRWTSTRHCNTMCVVYQIMCQSYEFLFRNYSISLQSYNTSFPIIQFKDTYKNYSPFIWSLYPSKMNRFCFLQLRKEFSLCRVYVKTATIRSFDRRPTNPISDDNCQITKEASPPNTNASKQTESSRRSSSGNESSDLLVSEQTLDWSLLNELDLDLNWFWNNCLYRMCWSVYIEDGY